MYVYLNHELTAEENAKISIFDHGYLYGIGLFETFRTYRGKPFLLEEHMQRLAFACQEIGLEWKQDLPRLRAEITDLLTQNGLEDGYFRYNVAAGAYPIGLPSAPYQSLTEALFVKALPEPSGEKVLTTLSLRRNTPEGSIRFKSHHYMNNILAKQETPLGAEGVFLTKEGYVAEGLVSNLFFVREDELYTPALETGILNGITREFVVELADEWHIPVHEGFFSLEFAQQADQVFVTNSIQEIVPVTRWDHIEYAPHGKGSVGEKLREHYKQSTLQR
ncbi:aminodeoxychorismate lyase [Bacillus horti]|uniref:4-amino-4-deoxychorismate lyase n=1 Tax=Caldalkalibacillus horti TaxID=77523 RepID=A0ABT9W2Z3_9BACI|nr:aminodeoxychorismate lyase [Bacillus horti]MDQ0167613.1 4-amino-4-deoxychorismate lyase [Bacillus horti]